MPAASNGGLDTARQASGKQVPMGVEPSTPHGNATNLSHDSGNAPPSGTHGADVSAAAHADTPSGFANHGAYVSSIAKGWGESTSDAHQNANANGPATLNPPLAIDTRFAHGH
jgi:hypothetical protein